MVDEPNGISPGLISGRLEGMSIPDLMWSLCGRRADGVLQVTRDAVRKTVYFVDGRMVFAASSDPDDRLGELLLREGLIELGHLEDAVSKLDSGKRLGTILVEAGHLSSGDLVRGVLMQVRNMVLDLFTWHDGEYDFKAGGLPTHEVITLNMQTGEILLLGIRRIRSFSRIRRSVGPPRTHFRMTLDGHEHLVGLELTAGEEHLLSRLDRNPVSIESLCQEVFMSNFEIYQALWAFKVLGVIEEDESVGTTVADASFEGVFGPESFAPMLVRLCRAEETGVLYLNRGAHERTIHIREGRCVFATSNDIDDGLVAYLLRRGVISLKDREETAKRLLSNKRVGTILREMGVIDELDLRNMVREHLSEIIYDTIRWDGGEYAFVAGELPTIEEITLETTVEELVCYGFRRVTSWSRVRDGIGGLEHPLMLTPDFLAVLDRMSIGPEEWEVVTSLRDPRSALQICQLSGLGDFRVCQILWTLRILGAVNPAPRPVVDPVVEPDAAEVAVPDVSFTPEGMVEHDESVEPEPEPTPLRLLETGDQAETPSLMAPPGFDETTEQELSAGDPIPVEDPATVVLDSGEEHPKASELSPEVQLGDLDDATLEFDEVDDTAARFDSEDTVSTGPVDSPAFELQTEEELAASEVSDTPPIDATQRLSQEEVEAVLRGESGGSEDDEDLEIGAPEMPPMDFVHDIRSSFESDAEDRETVFEESDRIEDEADPEVAVTTAEREFRGDGRLSVEEPWPTVQPILVDHDSSTELEAVEAVEEVDDVVSTHGDDAGDDAPQISEDESTAEISRTELEAAFSDSDPATPVGHDFEDREPVFQDLESSSADGDVWEPPEDLERQIARFNARQRVLYRTIRAEVGAGAANFVRSCCGQASAGLDDPFGDAEMRADGTWDVAGLRKTAIERRLPDPWAEYSRLLELEIETLQAHIGEARTRALREQIDRLETRPSTG